MKTAATRAPENVHTMADKVRYESKLGTFLEAMQIVNAPGMTWKVRRALLRAKFGLDDAMLDALVPAPPDGRDFHPSDY